MKNNKHYKAVFLDWDDTIGDFHNSELHALSDIYMKYNLHELYPSFEDYYNTYHPHNILLWDKYGRSEVTKEQLQLNRFLFPLLPKSVRTQLTERYIIDFKSLTEDSLVATARQIGKDFCKLTLDYGTVLPNAEYVVKELAKRYKLTIVSNGFVEMQYVKIEKSGLKNYFQHIVLSEETGVQKPNPIIYQKALQLNGILPHEAIMIGDGYSSDIQGAINAGIDQIWITQKPDSRPATYIISEISEALNIL